MEGPYTPLINAMDRYDNAQGLLSQRLLSPREKAYAVLSHENSLANFFKNGKVFSSVAADRGPRQVGLFNYYRGDQIHYRAPAQPTQKRKKREGERQEPGILEAGGIAILAGVAAAAAGYSARRLLEIREARSEIDAILPDAKAANDTALYFNEPKECKERLVRELTVAREGLDKDLQYYSVTTFSGAMLLLAAGALAYHRLYRVSSNAWTLAIASLLASAVSFGGALGFCGMGGAERKRTLEILNDSFAERRVVLKRPEEPATRYDAVVQLNQIHPPPPPQPQPSAPPQASDTNYPDLYATVPIYGPQDFSE